MVNILTIHFEGFCFIILLCYVHLSASPKTSNELPKFLSAYISDLLYNIYCIFDCVTDIHISHACLTFYWRILPTNLISDHIRDKSHSVRESHFVRESHSVRMYHHVRESHSVRKSRSLHESHRVRESHSLCESHHVHAFTVQEGRGGETARWAGCTQDTTGPVQGRLPGHRGNTRGGNLLCAV